MEGPANIIWNTPRVFPQGSAQGSAQVSPRVSPQVAPQISKTEAAGAPAIVWNVPRVLPAQVAYASTSADPVADKEFMPFGDDGLTFLDFLDIINPLQHIPIVSTIYRYLTGDELSPASRIAGGALYGGIIGAAVSVANVIVEYASGKDMGEHVLSLFVDDKAAETLTAGTDAILNGVGLNVAPEIVWNGPRTVAAAPAGTIDIALMRPQNPTAVSSAPMTPSGATAEPVLADETADVFAAVRRAQDQGVKDVSALPVPTGATAANGGWFSATMVTALAKYRQGAMLNERPQASALNISR